MFKTCNFVDIEFFIIRQNWSFCTFSQYWEHAADFFICIGLRFTFLFFIAKGWFQIRWWVQKRVLNSTKNTKPVFITCCVRERAWHSAPFTQSLPMFSFYRVFTSFIRMNRLPADDVTVPRFPYMVHIWCNSVIVPW